MANNTTNNANQLRMTGKLAEAYKRSERIKHLRNRIGLLSGPTLDQRRADKAEVEKMRKELKALAKS